jgi:hypothetical protein
MQKQEQELMAQNNLLRFIIGHNKHIKPLRFYVGVYFYL